MGHEGLKLVSYKDPVGIVTVCAGHTGPEVKLGQVKTEAECEALLKADVKYAEQAVGRLVTTPLTQNQFDALVSFVFNVGEDNFAKSTLLRKINANDCWGAGAEFPRWVQAKGQTLPGLVKRRADERKHFETGCPSGKFSVKARSTERYADASTVYRYAARRPEPCIVTLLASTLEPHPFLWKAPANQANFRAYA